MSEGLGSTQDPRVMIASLLAGIEPKIAHLSDDETIENVWSERDLPDGSIVQISTSERGGFPKRYDLLLRYDSKDPNFEIWEEYDLVDESHSFALLKKDNLFMSRQVSGETRLPKRPLTSSDRENAMNLLKAYQEAPANNSSESSNEKPKFERLKEIGRKALETLALFSPRKY